MAEVTERQKLLEREVERLGELVSLGLPSVLATVSFFLPMFGYVDVDEGSRYQESLPEQATLLGLVADPGGTGHEGAIRWTALALAVCIAACVLTTIVWTRQLEGWSGQVMIAAGLLAIPAFLVLWFLTAQDDGSGGLGTESVDPAGAYVLALVVPVWFLVARARHSSL